MPSSPMLERRAALSSAVGFLADAQLDRGELPSYRYLHPSLAGERQLDPSPFMTSLIVYALAFADDPRATALRERALRFLRAESEPPGLWRYWPQRSGRLIDPDLDDTCCAAFVVRAAEGREIEGNVPAILANRTPEGMFKTWVRDGREQNDVDSVVNANVVLYLGTRPETERVIDVLCHVINTGAEASTYSYYLDPLALHYAVSRAYHCGIRRFGACRDAVLGAIAARATDFADPLLTALTLCTAFNLGESHPAWRESALRALLDWQRPDGSWQPVVFYCGPEPPTKASVWWASETLTTALCTEALARAV